MAGKGLIAPILPHDDESFSGSSLLVGTRADGFALTKGSGLGLAAVLLPGSAVT